MLTCTHMLVGTYPRVSLTTCPPRMHTCGCTHTLIRVCTLLHAHTLISTYTPQYFPHSCLRVHLAAHSQMRLRPRVSLAACLRARCGHTHTVILIPQCPLLSALHTHCMHPHTRAPVSLIACHCTHTLSYTLMYAYSHPAYCSALPPTHTPVCICSRCIVASALSATFTQSHMQSHHCIVVSLLPATCLCALAYTYRYAYAVTQRISVFHVAVFPCSVLLARTSFSSPLQTHTSILHSPACTQTCTL